MTDETKNLLIRDVGGRVQTNTFVKCIYMSSPNESFNHIIGVFDLEDIKFGKYKEYKPYLRQLSDMSDEEKEQYNKLEKLYEKIDFMNLHHFDYRGLIDMNFAIHASKDTYKN